jgi:hypothetical protein
VDFSVSDELAAIGESLIRFIDREVIPLEEKNRPLLANERRLFSEDAVRRARFLYDVWCDGSGRRRAGND